MSGIGATLAIMMMLFQGIDETGTAVARPLGEVHLNEGNGSYYQVFEFYGKPPHTWRHAKRMVRGYLYEGREGQLATVKDVETHYFLLLNFPMIRTSPMWLGLSATCNETADLLWVDGSNLADQSFRGFGEGALRDISRTCRARKDSGMEIPIFYEPDAFGVRWQMGRGNQNLTYMMVEFPVPTEEEAAEEGGQD
ncbi:MULTISPECIES: C-type lectin domain-containing protein [Kordiimonas]|jgi:hypothetical protein|uniref:C-type lectin domain-containing protein n=1 Tax=Kordiimonas TaxID=288021 RepID=UPI00257C3C08|nr:C-type lectin domain-containing protein [Kordiimonas sp. UBA4487]